MKWSNRTCNDGNRLNPWLNLKSALLEVLLVICSEIFIYCKCTNRLSDEATNPQEVIVTEVENADAKSGIKRDGKKMKRNGKSFLSRFKCWKPQQPRE